MATELSAEERALEYLSAHGPDLCEGHWPRGCAVAMVGHARAAYRQTTGHPYVYAGEEMPDHPESSELTALRERQERLVDYDQTLRRIAAWGSGRWPADTTLGYEGPKQIATDAICRWGALAGEADDDQEES